MKPAEAARVSYDPAVSLAQTETETTLYVAESQAMQAWERDLMHECADLLCTFGDTFLEVGLGLGLSALRIAGNPRTRSHTVLEKHQEVIDIFSAGHPSTPPCLEIVRADIFDAIGALAPERYDGILFDPALPMAMWRDTELWRETMPSIVRALRPGGAFIPFFSTRPELREQYWPHFESVIVQRRAYEAYTGTTYTHGQSGSAFIQCFIRAEQPCPR